MAQHPIKGRAREADGLSQGEALAVALSVGWMVVIGILFWMLPSDAPSESFARVRWIIFLIAIFTPVGLVWVAASSARTTRNLREDLVMTQDALEQVYRMQAAQNAAAQQAAPVAAPEPAPVVQAPAAPEPVVEPRSIPLPEAPASRFSSRREVSRLIVPRAAPQAPTDQQALALDTPPEDTNPPIERPDLIKALNFPDDENDNDGFAALRRALRDRGARKLVQASQDVLTLLSQDGIYMDDLRPDPVPADLWRRFAGGERGKSVDRLGAIKDQTYLSVISSRMREDTIFRDSVHHFLRRFDQMLVTFEDSATDTDLLELAETRTARAFMLLGRSTGTFD